MSGQIHPRVTFGLFEADLNAGHLWKSGHRVKLQSQPFRLLTILLRHPGQVVSREDLQATLWGKDTTVDFDHSIGIAVNKVREALGDSAENPRFVETLARRGYRFIAPVASIPDPAEVEQSALLAPIAILAAESALVQAPPASTSATAADLTPSVELESGSSPPDVAVDAVPAPPKWSLRWVFAAATALLTVVLGVVLLAGRHPSATPPHIVKLTQEGHFAPSLNNMESLAAIASDGVHLFAPVLQNGRSELMAISLNGGTEAPLNIPSEIASPTLADISPDGSQLLLRDHLSP